MEPAHTAMASSASAEQRYLALSRGLRTEHSSWETRSADASQAPESAARSSRPMRTYGCIVFGATGFTGRRVMVELASSAQGIRWAAAGRSRERVQAAVRDVGLVGMDIITADTTDRDSLLAMCAQTQVLINCAGPFRFHGEPVVAACVAAQTDYVDITGEPEFIDRSELMFSHAAQAQNVQIVHCCGFDSVPADEGALFLAEQFGQCSAIESFLQLRVDGREGFSLHSTTLECAVHGVKNADSLKRVRRDLEAHRRLQTLPALGPKLKVKDFYWEDRMEAFAVKFPGSDAVVVRKSNLYRSARLQTPQVQFAAYMVVGNWWNALRLGFHKSLIEGAVATDLGTDLVLKHPALFTAGAFTHTGPKDSQMAATSFAFDMYGALEASGCADMARVLAWHASLWSPALGLQSQRWAQTTYRAY